MQKLLLVHYYSENCATSRIWKVLPNMVFSPIWGEKWRRSEHAHASYPGLFFRPPGFSPYKGREERRVQGWRRLTGITNDELGKFRLNFSRCANRDVATLISLMTKLTPILGPEIQKKMLGSIQGMQIWRTTRSAPGTSCMTARLVRLWCFVLTCFPRKSCFVVDLVCFISLRLRVTVFLNNTRRD